MDSDRFERPKPCNWCGEVFEHKVECPKYRGSTHALSTIITANDNFSTVVKDIVNDIKQSKIKAIKLETFNKIIEVLEGIVNHPDKPYIDCFGGDTECLYCDKHFIPGNEQHEDSCPILIAKKLLEELK